MHFALEISGFGLDISGFELEISGFGLDISGFGLWIYPPKVIEFQSHRISKSYVSYRENLLCVGPTYHIYRIWRYRFDTEQKFVFRLQAEEAAVQI